MTVRTYTGAAGNRLVASRRGERGRPVLLLHGGGQTRHAWDATARALAQAGWLSVAVDQRGHGDSEWLADGHYAGTDYADDAVAIAQELLAETGQPPVAVGASLGGIASLLAFTPPRVPVFAGLVLVDIVPRMDPRGVDHIQGFMRAHALVGFANIEEAADAVAAYLPHRPRPRSLDGLRKNLRLSPDGRWRWHWDPRFLEGPRTINTDSDGLVTDMEAGGRAVAVPSMLVRGGGSELVSEEAAQAFLALAPDCEYADIAGARHMVAGDRNDVFAATILAFLKRRFGGALAD